MDVLTISPDVMSDSIQEISTTFIWPEKVFNNLSSQVMGKAWVNFWGEFLLEPQICDPTGLVQVSKHPKCPKVLKGSAKSDLVSLGRESQKTLSHRANPAETFWLFGYLYRPAGVATLDCKGKAPIAQRAPASVVLCNWGRSLGSPIQVSVAVY